MANQKNLANGLIGTALTSADTTLVLQAGYGDSMPAVPFFLTITPAGQLSTMGNSEIVRVTARTGDTLTIERAQKGTAARAFSIGDIVSNSIYAEGSFDSLDVAGEHIFLTVHPVGSIYMSVSNVNPGTVFGGTWVAWGTGRVPVGVDTGQTEFNTVEKTGGAKTHTLTVGEMPSHNHTIPTAYGIMVGSTGGTGRLAGTGIVEDYAAKNLTSTGGGGAHNNLQPYITCYMWKRTA